MAPRILILLLTSILNLAFPVLISAQNGKEIKYDSMIQVIANSFYEKEFWWVVKNERWGILDSSMKQIVPCIYTIPNLDYYTSPWESCTFQTSNPVVMLRDSTADLVDLEKGVISPPYTEFIKSEGSVFVFKAGNKKYGVMNKTGKFLIPPISEKQIRLVFDSLLLLYYNNNFCYHNYQNKVVKSPEQFIEFDYRNTINNLILKGAFNNCFRFYFDTLNIAKEDFIPALIYFEENYEDKKKFDGLKNMLDSFTNQEVVPMYLTYCFEDVAGSGHTATNQYSNIPQSYYSIKGLGNNIIEYHDMNLEASGVQVYYSISNFQYCQIIENKINELEFSDFFSNKDRALKKINAFIDSIANEEGNETLKLVSPEDRMITDSSIFSLEYLGLETDGITFWLFFFNNQKIGRSEDQYQLTIPFSVLAEFIPENGLIEQIQSYQRKVH